jgi:hypothetical protein
MSKSKSSSAIIMEDTVRRRIMKDVDPGYIYDDRKYLDVSYNIKPNVYVSSKYKDVKNDSPAPG